MALLLYLTFVRSQNIVFVDESGLNRHYRRLYARAKRGVKVYGKRPGKREKRTNIIAGLLYSEHEKRHIAVRCYEQTTTAWFFEDWFEFELIPLLPDKALVIMDNASFHRKNALWEIAERYGIFVLFLPPYSPEFNPIEHSWANFKEWLKYNGERFSCFDWAVETYFT
jgi:transposase